MQKIVLLVVVMWISTVCRGVRADNHDPVCGLLLFGNGSLIKQDPVANEALQFPADASYEENIAGIEEIVRTYVFRLSPEQISKLKSILLAGEVLALKPQVPFTSYMRQLREEWTRLAAEKNADLSWPLRSSLLMDRLESLQYADVKSTSPRLNRFFDEIGGKSLAEQIRYIASARATPVQWAADELKALAAYERMIQVNQFVASMWPPIEATQPISTVGTHDLWSRIRVVRWTQQLDQARTIFYSCLLRVKRQDLLFWRELVTRIVEQWQPYVSSDLVSSVTGAKLDRFGAFLHPPQQSFKSQGRRLINQIDFLIASSGLFDLKGEPTPRLARVISELSGFQNFKSLSEREDRLRQIRVSRQWNEIESRAIETLVQFLELE